MKVYKYLFSVIVMLGLISCSSEESDFENDVVSTVGQYTVAFNLSNDITTKAAGGFTPTTDEANINEFVLFICDSQEGKIIQKGYFKGNKDNTCTFNFKPIAGRDNYYVYAVANAGQLNSVTEGSSVADLKNATASIPTHRPTLGGNPEIVVSALPKMGGMEFKIDLGEMSEVQELGVIPVYQLVSKLQLQVSVNFVGESTGADFYLTDIKWSGFSRQGKIGGNDTETNGDILNDRSDYSFSIISSAFNDYGSPLYTFPNVSKSVAGSEDSGLINGAELYIEGIVRQDGKQIGDSVYLPLSLENETFVPNTKYNVQVTVTGTLSNPVIELASVSVISMGEENVDVDFN